MLPSTEVEDKANKTKTFKNNMYSNSKDQRAIEEAYLNIHNEERMQYTPHGIPITWETNTRNGDWDGNVEVDGKTYYVNTYYSVDVVDDRGDKDTPPSLTIKHVMLDGEEFYAEDQDGDFDILLDKEANPELYDKIASAVKSKVAEYEYQR